MFAYTYTFKSLLNIKVSISGSPFIQSVGCLFSPSRPWLTLDACSTSPVFCPPLFNSAIAKACGPQCYPHININSV